MKKNDFVNFLVNNGFDYSEAKAEVNFALEVVLGKTKEELIFLEEFDQKIFMEIFEKRVKTNFPLQYILNTAFFMGEKFYVDENVLIPRDETELLVREVLMCAKKGAKILDIGAGSGIISCMVAKKLPTSFVLGVDVSDKALLIAIKNKERLDIKNVEFKFSDLFSNVEDKFDIIVSNPPYIPIKQKAEIQKEVTYEPELALYSRDEFGVYFYEKIIEKAPFYLNNGGYILFEVMQGQAQIVQRLLAEGGFCEIKAIKDLAGIQRTIRARKI